MRKSIFRILSVALALSALVSCSVFDDRTGCPSYLTVWYDLFPGSVVSSGRNLSLLVNDSEKVAFDENINADDYPSGTVIKVKKGLAVVSAWTGIDGMVRNGHVLMTKEGGECDSLYLHVGHPDCCDDLSEDHVQMHKQFCTLTVVVEGGEVWGGNGLWTILSHWNGLDVIDASSVSGDLSSYMRYMGEGTWQCRIIRQGDDSLTLEFEGPTGEPLHFDLGAIMAEAGYDWSALDLEDFTLYIRQAEGEWIWSIAPWNDGGDQIIRV